MDEVGPSFDKVQNDQWNGYFGSLPNLQISSPVIGLNLSRSAPAEVEHSFHPTGTGAFMSSNKPDTKPAEASTADIIVPLVEEELPRSRSARWSQAGCRVRTITDTAEELVRQELLQGHQRRG